MTSENYPLVLYVNPKWRRTGGIHSPLLNPWWGNPLTDSSLFTKELFDHYTFDTAYYSITEDIRVAKMVLSPYPHRWLLAHDPTLLSECVARSREKNLPLLIDGLGDIEIQIGIENAYVLRYGGYRFLPEKNSIHIPLFADDLLERCRSGHLEIRGKTDDKPTVGFAGWTTLSKKQWLRTIVKELPVRLRGLFDARYCACTKGVLWRQKAIDLLSRSPLVTFACHTRSSFSGSAKTAATDQRTLREEMVATILESDYALDVRGDANNSARLFEILSLGRIPVIVDTERNFPFSDKIDYSSFALIVDFRDIKRLPERIAEFHARLSPERFVEMQRNARDAYVRYFRIEAMTRFIVDAVRQ